MSSDPADPRDVPLPLGESMSAVLRRLAEVWGGPCLVRVPYGNGPVAASSPAGDPDVDTASAPPLTLPLNADGEVLGVLELAAGSTAPTAEQQAAAQAVADALALVLRSEQRCREAERESRAKEEIMAALAHDLRSPLNAITGWCHMLQTGSLAPAQHDNAVEIIARNARAQGQLIGDVADLARLLAGRLPLEWASVDAGAVLREAVKAAEPMARAKNVSLEAVSPSEAAPVRADSDRFGQVVRLVLAHALKMSRQRGSITAQVAARGGEVELAIETAGAGLVPEALGALFDVTSAPGASRRPGSLGLDLVRRLVQLQGGTVGAESEGPGSPLRVTVTFPRLSAPS